MNWQWWRGRLRSGRPAARRSARPGLEQCENRVVPDGGLAGLEAAQTFVGSLTNPALVGQPVALTAVVVPEDGTGPTPTGTVTFSNSGRPLGTAALTGGQALLIVNDLSLTTVATHAITATYHGDLHYFGDDSEALGQFIAALATRTTLTATPNPSAVGQTVTFTVVVTPEPPEVGIPTGGVELTVDGETLVAGVLDATGHATLTASFEETGVYDIVATYEGDDTFSESSSSTLRQSVVQASTTTALEIDIADAVFGQPVTLTATVSAEEPAEGVPTGLVTFRAGQVVLGDATVDEDGLAVLEADDIPLGTLEVVATYEGDNDFASSTSDEVSLTVSRAGTEVYLEADPEEAGLGERITFTSRVLAVAPSTGTPTGQVVLLDRNVALAVGQLVDGEVEFVLDNLTLGRHPITARYDGSPGYAGGTSGEVTTAVGTFNQRWVGTLYNNLLQRPADPSGVTTFTGLVGVSQDYETTALQLMNACGGTPLRCEFFEVTVRDLYRQLLRREPDAGGLAVHAEFLRQGGTIAQLRATLLGSAEYFANTQWGGAGDTSAWLTALYRDVFDRTLTTQERTFWLQVIGQGAGRNSVALSLVRNNEEALSRTVQGYYQRLLAREANDDEVEAALTQFRAGQDEKALIAALVSSSEYLAVV